MQRSSLRPHPTAAPLGLLLLSTPLAAQTVEFPVPTAGSRPYTIVAGPDGNCWFTESNGNKIGRITPAGVITEFPVPTPGSGPYGIAVGPDGNIWFTERFANQIGVLDLTTFQIVEFPIPTWDSQPWEITAGADGQMWFTEDDAHQIGSITMGGIVTEYDIATAGCCFQLGIAAGPGGNVWYTIEIGDQIGQIAPGAVFTQHQIQSVQVLPWDIIPGPDGNMWFTELAGRAVGRITPAGVITEFPIAGNFSGIAGIASGSNGNFFFTENDTDQLSEMDLAGNVLGTLPTGDMPLSVCNGSDGNIWYTVAAGNAIGRLQVAQRGTEHILSMDCGYVPVLRNVQLGQDAQWIFNGPKTHAVRDAHNLGFLDSGPKEPGSSYRHTFNVAGAFVYRNIGPGFKRAAINVRLVAPPTGTVGVPFQITWASGPMPAGHVEDVAVLTPGAPDYVLYVSSSSSQTIYVPSVPGEYLFRARLRNPVTGAACTYSRPTSVIVN